MFRRPNVNFRLHPNAGFLSGYGSCFSFGPGVARASLHYHIVFSTKNRAPCIDPKWQSELHDYLGGTVKGLGGVSQGIGGVNDHVHLLVGWKATHRISDFMRELKKASSFWVHEKTQFHDFAWQEGYGAFTISPNVRHNVQKYIANQVKHHRKKSFRDELKELLIAAGIEFEDQFLD